MFQIKQYLPRKDNSFDSIEIFVEYVSILLAGKVAHTLMYAKLYTPHQGGGLELLVSHFPTLHPPMSELLTLHHFCGVVG